MYSSHSSGVRPFFHHSSSPSYGGDVEDSHPMKAYILRQVQDVVDLGNCLLCSPGEPSRHRSSAPRRWTGPGLPSHRKPRLSPELIVLLWVRRVHQRPTMYLRPIPMALLQSLQVLEGPAVGGHRGVNAPGGELLKYPIEMGTDGRLPAAQGHGCNSCLVQLVNEVQLIRAGR
jgi:hypothetical protein